jgi:hypothetical protein
MPTLFSKTYAYSKQKEVPLLNNEKMIELGKIVVGEYFKSGINKYLNYVVIKQPEGEFKVLNYPKEFTPKMNELIDSYYSTVASSQRKRKRIKRQEKVYSTKDFKK